MHVLCALVDRILKMVDEHAFSTTGRDLWVFVPTCSAIVACVLDHPGDLLGQCQDRS